MKHNPKTVLFEYCQQHGVDKPFYESWTCEQSRPLNSKHKPKLKSKSKSKIEDPDSDAVTDETSTVVHIRWLAKVQIKVDGVWYSGQAPIPTCYRAKAEKMAAYQVAEALGIADTCSDYGFKKDYKYSKNEKHKAGVPVPAPTPISTSTLPTPAPTPTALPPTKKRGLITVPVSTSTTSAPLRKDKLPSKSSKPKKTPAMFSLDHNTTASTVTPLWFCPQAAYTPTDSNVEYQQQTDSESRAGHQANHQVSLNKTLRPDHNIPYTPIYYNREREIEHTAHNNRAYNAHTPTESVRNIIQSTDVKIYNKVYMIDLENKPAFRAKLEPDCLYIGFINSIHNAVSSYRDWHTSSSESIEAEVVASNNNRLLYTIAGGTPDLVDHFMTFFVTPVLDYVGKREAKIFIVSGDHASWCTRACLERVISWRNLTRITITNTARIV